MEGEERTKRNAVRRRCAAALAAGALSLTGAALPAAQPATPLEVYGQLPTLEDIVVSPDGSRVAFVQTLGEQRNLYVKAMAERSPLAGARIGDTKQRSMQWIDDDNLLIEISGTSFPPIGLTGPRREWRQLLTYDISKKKLAAIDFKVPSADTLNVVNGPPMVRVVDGASTVFVPGVYVTDRTLPGLFKYEVAGRRTELIARGTDAWTEWLVDESGRIAGEFDYYDDKKQWEFKVPKESRGMRVVASGSAPIDVPSMLGFASAGDSVLMSFPAGRDEVWRPLSLKDGSLGAPLGEHERFSEVIEDRKSGRIVGGIRGPPRICRDFDWWAQALADQGYAVLQPNFRGSDLNSRFLAAGFGQWGRKMQSDLSDGVAYLANKGGIDPKRVCIVGASYGGYAALAGITLQPGIYRCAVSVAGISDLKRFLQWTGVEQGRRDSNAKRWRDRFMGASGPNDPALQSISPIEHVSAISAPVLLIHGKDDTVVPYEQSERMADALKGAGKPAELVTLKNEDWLSRGATRLQMLEATVAFLKANNPPD